MVVSDPKAAGHIELHLRVALPRQYYAEGLRLCLLLDDARLLSDEDAVRAASHVRACGTLDVDVGVDPSTPHYLGLLAIFDGQGIAHGYHFEVRSAHKAEFAGNDRAVLRTELLHVPGAPVGQGIEVRWDPKADASVSP